MEFIPHDYSVGALKGTSSNLIAEKTHFYALEVNTSPPWIFISLVKANRLKCRLQSVETRSQNIIIIIINLRTCTRYMNIVRLNYIIQYLASCKLDANGLWPGIMFHFCI